MPDEALKSSLPIVEIDNPKNKSGERVGLDISDHYPIIINGPLKIISYNLQFMPTLIGGVAGKKNKAEITQAVTEFANYFVEQNADFCCVQELFDNTANQIMEAEMLKRGYVATDRVGKESASFFNGGARTFVKEKLAALELTSYEHVYKNKIDYLIGADAIVNKGATHTSILHEDGTKTHVFNTHLQAYYINREHYAEITLAQCVEFKKFIEDQKAKGIIGPDDKIFMCGDFNIPKQQLGEEMEGEEARTLQFLYEKMTRILGPQFTFLDYSFKPSGPVHTFSRENAYNAHLPPSSDHDVNVDMAIVFDPKSRAKLSAANIELSEIYGDIQLATAHFVSQNATLFSKWLLSAEKNEALNKFNIQVKALMTNADALQEKGINPLDDPAWFAQALKLLSGPRTASMTVEKTVDRRSSVPSPEEIAEYEMEEDDIDPQTYAEFNDIEQSKKKFEKLLQDVSKLDGEIHKNYMDSPDDYEKVYETSLRLKHVLLTAGEEFYSKPPTIASMKKFRCLCERELNTAKTEFEKHATAWSSLSFVIKGILAFFAALSVVVAAIVATKSPHGFTGSFFRPAESEILTGIKQDFVAPD